MERSPRAIAFVLAGGVVLAAFAAGVIGIRSRTASRDALTRPMTLAEAAPVIAAVGDRAPAQLRNATDAIWSQWVHERDSSIRARLDRGDEDSLVNLLLYGTTFTRQPRTTPEDLGDGDQSHLEEIMDGRVQDLVMAVEAPEGDERLQFARQVIEHHGFVVGRGSRETTRQYLVSLRSRMLTENEQYIRRLRTAPDSSRAEASATLYRDRGLSSDTSLRVDYALDATLATLQQRGELTRLPIDHVAIVGPGLDVIDKAQGHDLFPVQSIQPFAVAETLLRLGASKRPSIVAMDISPRVLAHLRGAQERATHGGPYRLNVLLESDTPGTRIDSGLVEYWSRFGDRIGTATTAGPNGDATRLRVRRIDVRPDVVRDVTAADVDVIVERPSEHAAGQGFDLIVATNVFVYYDPFEQALAAANVSRMLGNGGLLLTNQPLPVPAAAGLSLVLARAVAFDRLVGGGETHERGDTIYAYRKS